MTERAPSGQAGDRVERFLGMWATFVLACTIVFLGSLLAIDVVMQVYFRITQPGGDYPSLIVYTYVWGIPWVCAAVGGGWIFVFLHRWVVTSDPPFLRWGYLGIAACPVLLVGWLTHGLNEDAVTYLGESMEALILLALLELMMAMSAIVSTLLWRRGGYFEAAPGTANGTP